MDDTPEREREPLPRRRVLHQPDIHGVPADRQLQIPEHRKCLGHPPAGHLLRHGAAGEPRVRPELLRHLHPLLPEQVAELGVEQQERRGGRRGEEEGSGEGTDGGEGEGQGVVLGGEGLERVEELGRVEGRGGEEGEVGAGLHVDELRADLTSGQGVPGLEHLVLEGGVEVELDGVAHLRSHGRGARAEVQWRVRKGLEGERWELGGDGGHMRWGWCGGDGWDWKRRARIWVRISIHHHARLYYIIYN